MFDAQGKQLARVQSPAPIGYSTFITATHLFTVIKDKDDVPTVVRYRIAK